MGGRCQTSSACESAMNPHASAKVIGIRKKPINLGMDKKVKRASAQIYE